MELRRRKSKMKEWFVVQTQVNSEQIAAANIKQKGFEVYYPNFFKTISHARKTKKVIKPLFPRYIFVSFNKNKDNWNSYYEWFFTHAKKFYNTFPGFIDKLEID